MGEKATLFRGVVRNGVVVFDCDTPLPEGTAVSVAVEPVAEAVPTDVIPFTEEERAEFAGWDEIGDEAWAMIDEWEKGEEGTHAAG